MNRATLQIKIMNLQNLKFATYSLLLEQLLHPSKVVKVKQIFHCFGELFYYVFP